MKFGIAVWEGPREMRPMPMLTVNPSDTLGMLVAAAIATPDKDKMEAKVSRLEGYSSIALTSTTKASMDKGQLEDTIADLRDEDIKAVKKILRVEEKKPSEEVIEATVKNTAEMMKQGMCVLLQNGALLHLRW